MLDPTLPIELTHEGILLDKTGRHWEKGKYPANTVPYELTEDVRGKNIANDTNVSWSMVPKLPSVIAADRAIAKEKLAQAAPTPAPTPAPAPAPAPTA